MALAVTREVSRADTAKVRHRVRAQATAKGLRATAKVLPVVTARLLLRREVPVGTQAAIPVKVRVSNSTTDRLRASRGIRLKVGMVRRSRRSIRITDRMPRERGM